MAVVFSDIGSDWGLKKLFCEETEDAVEDFAAAVKAAQEFAAAAKAAAVKAAEEYAAAAKKAEECAAAANAAEEAAKAAEEMAVAFSDIGSVWGLKKLFYEESEEEKKATKERAAAAKESATSKVSYEGVRQVYPCLCYPKELLKKEDEERNKPDYVDEPPRPFVVERRKMFIEWATKHGKRYNSLYECRLRYKIWVNTKERMEQICSKSGRTFSIEKMTMDADQTQIEFKLGNRGRVKPSEQPLSDVKRSILGTMGESWMEIMGKEFENWAERHKRVYSSTEEREKRLLAYLYNMRTIHMWEESYPGEWGHGNDLENMDHFPWEKVLVPPVECSRCRPRKQAPQEEEAKAAQECAAAAKVAEEMAVAILYKQLYTAPAAAFEKESTTSKVPYEGVRQVYPCLCYPKELLKKEDEERNKPDYVEEPPEPFMVERRKMFIEWATDHKRRYNSLYEVRLRYKIWLNFKERKEQLCSKSGRKFSMKEMTMDADETQIEFKLGNRGRVKQSEQPVSDVKRCILSTMGESWMENMGKEFEMWAERHKRVYSSTEEREKRLLAYLYNRRTIHYWEESYPGEWGYGNDLENMDHFPWEKELVPPIECSRCRPRKQAPQGSSCLLQAPQQG